MADNERISYPYLKKAPMAVKVYGHTREGLYAPAITLDTGTMKAMPLALQQKMARVFYSIARQARDMAREKAPVATGALVAGIYVTAPASKANLGTANAGGQLNPHEMKGHSRAYFSAIQAAAKRAGIFVPNSAAQLADINTHSREGVSGGSVQTGFENIVHLRTQRLQKFKGIEDIGAAISGTKEDTDVAYQALNDALPFNPMGGAGLDTLFVSIGSAMYYSAWVEYGHTGAAPHPFFTEPAEWMIKECMRSFTTLFEDFKDLNVRLTT